MLKAKLDSVRKNKKGFSLVELIIVIAIMVALIAVMAPSFVKYVQKSRDSALATAAESMYTAVQTYYGDPDVAPQGVGSIIVKTSTETAPIVIVQGSGDDKLNDSDFGEIKNLAGVDLSKNMGVSNDVYTIKIESDGSGYKFSMSKTAA